jgi:hypothetical protein
MSETVRWMRRATVRGDEVAALADRAVVTYANAAHLVGA